MAYSIKFTSDSYFKLDPDFEAMPHRQPKAAADLSDTQKQFVSSGSEFPLSSYQTTTPTFQHIYVTLGKDKDGKQLSFQGKNKWLVFRPHVLILEDGQATNTVPKEIQKNTKQTGKTISLPGYESKFDLNGSVIANHWLTWNEVTHGGVRIPKTKEQVNNAIQLCKRIQPYRDTIGKPFIVTSCFRPDPYNRMCGGASQSKHLTLEAVDFYVDGFNNKKLASYFQDWDGGLGTYSYDDYIIHLDLGSKRRWGV
jgi:uncharacterized protein YcbK (DUF882 family)